MPKILFISRKRLILIFVVTALLVLGAVSLRWGAIQAVSGTAEQTRMIHLVTGEFKTTLPDGTELEAYRWDPGTIYVNKGERIELHILGINGDSHPFFIEGLNVRGEVKKGRETTVTFTADKEGIYRIICLSHPDRNHNGPMIGYIVVD